VKYEEIISNAKALGESIPDDSGISMLFVAANEETGENSLGINGSIPELSSTIFSVASQDKDIAVLILNVAINLVISSKEYAADFKMNLMASSANKDIN
jgi:hypothetical protein